MFVENLLLNSAKLNALGNSKFSKSNVGNSCLNGLNSNLNVLAKFTSFLFKVDGAIK